MPKFFQSRFFILVLSFEVWSLSAKFQINQNSSNKRLCGFDDKMHLKTEFTGKESLSSFFRVFVAIKRNLITRFGVFCFPNYKNVVLWPSAMSPLVY